MKVLISAYACEPNKGSEPGAGWNWSLAAAKDNDVWVLTRANNQPAIEAELAQHPVSRLRFVYLDLPRPLSFWKKGPRGVRLYYLLWQVVALREARQLHTAVGFDVVHHLTFANMWLPALTGFLEVPFLLGPVGGGPRVPFRLYRQLGAVGAAREAARVGLQIGSRFNPLTRASWSRATTIIVQNRETRAALPRRHRSRTVLRTHTSLPDIPVPTSAGRAEAGRHALLAGRLVAWKGGALALRAIARTPDWSLTIIGSGPDYGRLATLVSELGLGDRVEFLPWAAQHELWEAMVQADVLLLPSLRDDAPFVVGEAQMVGLPVVAFEQGGPREFAQFPGSTVLTVPLTRDPAGAFADGLRRAAAIPRASRGEPYSMCQLARFVTKAYVATLNQGKRPVPTRPRTES